MNKAYWDNFTHYVYLAVAFTFFYVAFTKGGKIILSKYGPSGLQEALS